MSRIFLLEECAYYSDERVNGANILTNEFVSTDSLLQNKGGITNPVSLPKGNLISYGIGDILVGNIRPYLKKIWYSNRAGGCSPDVLVFRAKKNINSKFLYYSLFRNDFFAHMMKGAKGTKMPRGDKKQIMRFEIPLFDLVHQQKVASVLSALDAKIELNNRINAELESMAKTIYDYWFVQFDFPDKNGKPYKSSGGKMVWNEELKREVPEGWEVKSLFDVCKVQYGFPFSTNYFNSCGDGVPVIRIRDIIENSVSNYSAEESIDDKYLIKLGDILIGMDGNFHINYWSKSGCYLNQRVVKLSETVLPNIYLKYQVEPYIKLREESVSRTTVGHLSDKDLKAIRVLVPSKEILSSIKVLYKNSLKKIIHYKNENQQLVSLRDWLLPMLMNGQVRV